MMGSADQIAAFTDGKVILQVLPENINVVLHQLESVNPIALLRQGMTVSPGACADLQDSHAGPEVFCDVAHGGQVLHHTIPRAQPAVLIIGTVIRRQFFRYVHFLSSSN